MLQDQILVVDRNIKIIKKHFKQWWFHFLNFYQKLEDMISKKNYTTRQVASNMKEKDKIFYKYEKLNILTNI